MKLLASLAEKFRDITKAATRFPVAFLLLVAIAVLNALSIENRQDYGKPVIALVLGVFVFTVAQVLFERFGKTVILRAVFMLGAAAVTTGYYLMILPASEINIEIGVRTAAAVFALLTAFILIPSVKGHADFNQVFMIVFKSFFTAAFFSAVIWGGVSLIILAVDSLLFKVGSNAYIHTANWIWVVWTPMLFLSLIPAFNRDERENEKAQRASYCPKFLEILISYVLVPLAAVYSLVLLIYIAKTVVIRNWSDNLLEPLILSYCVAVLLILILSAGLKNRFAALFRLIFPKLLIPVALFQIVSSSIVACNEGIIHTRYFVLLFCLYSAVCGVWLSIAPVKKNGFIAVLAIVFAVVSILPPVDAFTLSRTSQTALLRGALEKNKMLQGNQILANADIPATDKKTIVRSVTYMNEIGEIGSIRFLPEKFDVYADFEKTFGFASDAGGAGAYTEPKAFTAELKHPMEIGSYDYFDTASFYISAGAQRNPLCSVTKGGKKYDLVLNVKDSDGSIDMTGPAGEKILSAALKPMIDSIALNEGAGKGLLPADKMTFDFENDQAKMRIVFQNISIDYASGGASYNAAFYILFSIR